MDVEISNYCDVCGRSPVFIAVCYGEIETKYCRDCAFVLEPEEAHAANSIKVVDASM